eukprot:1025806-Prymnesium_polylepis.1
MLSTLDSRSDHPCQGKGETPKQGACMRPVDRRTLDTYRTLVDDFAPLHLRLLSTRGLQSLYSSTASTAALQLYIAQHSTTSTLTLRSESDDVVAPPLRRNRCCKNRPGCGRCEFRLAEQMLPTHTRANGSTTHSHSRRRDAQPGAHAAIGAVGPSAAPGTA